MIVPCQVRSARTCKLYSVQTSPHRKDFFFLSLHVTARSWSTPVPCNCWHLRHSSNCVLLDFGCAGLGPSSLLSMPPCLCFNTVRSFFFKYSLGKNFTDMAMFTLLQTVQENTVKTCSKLTPVCFFWTWQSIRISFVKTSLMSSDLFSLMTQDKEGSCAASCCFEWGERQSEWFLSSSWTE